MNLLGSFITCSSNVENENIKKILKYLGHNKTIQSRRFQYFLRPKNDPNNEFFDKWSEFEKKFRKNNFRNFFIRLMIFIVY